MLLMSTADESELEYWRNQFGKCQLPPEKMRPQPALQDVIDKLPGIMSLLIQTRQKAGGWLGPMYLKAEEVKDIEFATNISRREIMLLLLDVASALAQTPVPGGHIGAVLEAGSGALYVGAPLVWEGKGIKFTVHGVQAAILSAWHHDETQIKSIMVETIPCTCCRQFIRETVNYHNTKLVMAADGSNSKTTGDVKEIELNPKGLKVNGIRSRLMAEARRTTSKPDMNELVLLATQASNASYAPYSRNFAGVALRTKKGTIHQGRYAEVGNSIAGVLAIESALVNVALSGEKLDQVKEILLIETRGVVTQFAATQQLATAMGNVPFRFTMKMP